MRNHLNLLPAAVKRQQLVSRRIKQWSAVVLLGLVALSIHAWSEWRHHGRGLSRLEALRAEALPIKELQDENDKIRAEIAQLRDREAIVLQLADERSVLSLLGIVSQAASTCQGNIRLLKFQLEKSSDPASPVGRHLLLEGIGSDHLAVAQFAGALRDSNAFLDVQLKSSASQGNESGEERNYSLECTF